MSQRAVFDCMVFLQAAMRATGPAAACFRLVDAGHVELCISAESLTEVQEVLCRPSLQRRYKSLSPENVEKFLAEVARKTTLVSGAASVFSYPRDPKDELYVDLAAAARARYLVTRDRDLLDLMNDDTPEGKDFRQRFPDLMIVDPVSFLEQFLPKKGDDDSAQPNAS